MSMSDAMQMLLPLLLPGGVEIFAPFPPHPMHLSLTPPQNLPDLERMGKENEGHSNVL